MPTDPLRDLLTRWRPEREEAKSSGGCVGGRRTRTEVQGWPRDLGRARTEDL